MFMVLGIVYCFTQKESEEVAAELRQHGIRAGCYHANIPPKQKSQIHEMWLADKLLASSYGNYFLKSCVIK